ncbi:MULTISPECIES: (2Fe-2S)-binding protein [Priestia]|jgi:bacterioferritin-associated ferredoxin|uniref:(2Fe-2S)-binding protein n=1 Tax=Priestia TaxID=2800373 RepID=UPI0002F3CE3F|nr:MULTISPECIES: (2Fe-2S)-binding protein [Priestia]KAB2492668.1 (2Fe-2S)-binding protein [Priestia endophytica]MCM3537289.1 (2Fe-2S)-binding protein [Priestia endophytica]RAS72914.1 (2Fe-2S)-binding protein [Priestia endophytica]RAS84799.1 (2Fe-2S)-binding protein [Priestia endophytica]RJS64619.1 (2Fe-2S)-binding protein [Priestia filamentosa]
MNENQIVVCRCEEITLGEIKGTVERFQCSSREVKLRTRAGMGPCGGRTCRGTIDKLVEQLGGPAVSDEVSLSYRPPVRPVSFGVLGGETK